MVSKKEQETNIKKEAEIKAEEKTYCYIGPNLPDGRLKKNLTIIGTKTGIKERYKEEIEKYPQIERLMVRVETLADAKTKVETEGNILNKYYKDVEATMAAEERKE